MNELYANLLSSAPQNLPWIKDRILFATMHGSIAYGLNTPESDVDIRGFCSTPKEYVFGFIDNFDQWIASEPYDSTIYNVKKFIKLAAQGNPSMMEILFTSEKHHLHVTDMGKLLLDNKELFLHAGLKERYIGYAKSQAHRIRSHRKFLLNPPTEKPTRESVGLKEMAEITKNEYGMIKSLVNAKLEEWNPSFEPFSESQKIYLQNKLSDILNEFHITKDDQWVAACRHIGLDDKLIHVMQLEKQYENRLGEWNQYNEWKKNRNKKRAAIEEKFGFDCFSHDTEFLTDDGWKLFDDITEKNKLATVFIKEHHQKTEERTYDHKQDFSIEYQDYTERFDANFNGNLYNFLGNHLDVLVTPNHRMLSRPNPRMSSLIGNWELEEASNLEGTVDFLKVVEPKKSTYENKKFFQNIPIGQADYIKLMGAFLSDGTFTFKNGKVKTIRISQKKNNRLHRWMTYFKKRHSNISALYQNVKPISQYRTVECTEIVLCITDSNLVKKLYQDCGHSKNKRIPRWVFGLSKRLMEMLYDFMHKGDGTVRQNKKSDIYYSSVKNLADDVQELCFLCGFETSLYGPYTSRYQINGETRQGICYQVHVNKNAPKFDRIIMGRNLKKIPVTNHRVVCFSVPNGTLITRRNGLISIQGNCKHGSQLVRLLRMGKEILSTGQVIVERIYDREELLAVKNGAWTYEQLLEYIAKTEDEVELAAKSSSLPNQPNMKKLDELCQRIVESSL